MDDLVHDLNRRFDHAALHPEVNEQSVVRLCEEAREHQFYSVAVNPAWVPLARSELKGSGVRILTVSGFPLGANRMDIKVLEAAEGVEDGADEIDMVANIGWLTEGRFVEAEGEIAKVRINLPHEVVLKVIIEAGKLTEAQQVEATEAVVNGGAQYVKTSTGFFGGATVEQVQTLHRAAEGRIKVKASGGIRTAEQCRRLLAAGAERLGSSASVAIMHEITQQAELK